MKSLNEMPQEYQDVVAKKLEQARHDVELGNVLTQQEARQETLELIQKLQQKQLSEQQEELAYA